MENQISNIITILTALLTGGFLMLFIENQQITTYVIERLAISEQRPPENR